MFSWLRGAKPVPAAWTIAPSPEHTYVVFAESGRDPAVARALADLDATLVEASRETRDDLTADGPADESLLDAFDDEGTLRTIVAEAVTVDAVDVVSARAATADPTTFANATSAVCVRLRVSDRVDALVPYALVAVAAAIAREADGRVYDTLGRRVLSDEFVAEPLAGLAIGSAGPHVTLVSSVGADGTLRFATLGLGKYGLFDVTLDGVPAALTRASDIVAAFVQSIVDPVPPFVLGPWKPDTEFVSAYYVRAFYNTDGPDARKSTFTSLGVRPGAVPTAPWAIVDERGKSLDAAAIAQILKRFDADRATAIRETAAAAT